MYFQRPIIPTHEENLFQLAPIPLYIKYFDDHDLHDEVYNIGLEKLTDDQKLMGQELPEQYDQKRQTEYNVNYNRMDMWVEPTEFNPIGSRYFVPPNDFLVRKEKSVLTIRERIEDGYKDMLNKLNFGHNNNPIITESWMQYYEPTSGRGHNQHNHCRWNPNEETELSFAGGYYLSDGDPIADHPYSGVFTFHVRGFSYFVRPKKGMLIIWPYDIVHSVKPFYGKSYRCVINFNIQDGSPLPTSVDPKKLI
jgi:hypothetical protein